MENIGLLWILLARYGRRTKIQNMEKIDTISNASATMDIHRVNHAVNLSGLATIHENFHSMSTLTLDTRWKTGWKNRAYNALERGRVWMKWGC